MDIRYRTISMDNNIWIYIYSDNTYIAHIRGQSDDIGIYDITINKYRNHTCIDKTIVLNPHTLSRLKDLLDNIPENPDEIDDYISNGYHSSMIECELLDTYDFCDKCDTYVDYISGNKIKNSILGPFTIEYILHEDTGIKVCSTPSIHSGDLIYIEFDSVKSSALIYPKHKRYKKHNFMAKVLTNYVNYYTGMPKPAKRAI